MANVQAQYQQQVIADVVYGIFEASPAAVSLHWQDEDGVPYRRLSRLKSALQAQQHTIQLLMNAGIYGTDDRPAGLWIEQGDVLHPLNRATAGYGNFHLQPNGVFWIENGRAYVETTQRYIQQSPNAVYAVQSGPMLLVDGKINPIFLPNIVSPYLRNAVCVSADNRLYFILTESRQADAAWPNFYQFARALQQLGCQQALYLDGSISAWYIPQVSSGFHWSHFVGMIAVTDVSTKESIS